MAIFVETPDAKVLLSQIKAAIDAGRVDTWEYDADGDFTHSAQQWIRKAWLRPTASSDGLRLRIIAPQGGTITNAIYGVYHGRFIEMLLTHFRSTVSSVSAD